MSDPTGKGDYNLQEAWDTVCQSFAKTTNIDLTATPKYSIDQVLDQIRAKQDDDEQRNAKYKTAKEVIGKTLDCIQILGGIASQGASMVFGPSALCFNAVTYLIQAGVKFKQIFTSLSELFTRISDVLERCRIYLRMPADAVDIALRRIINDELLCFVDICSLSMKVLKRHSVLIALKVFAFNGDEGVGAQLSRLANLVEKESQMRATLGFESQKTNERSIAETREGTKKINENVDKLLEFEQKKNAESMEKKQLQEIDINLHSPSKNFDKIHDTYLNLLSKRVAGSGQWLRSDAVYTEWATSENSPLEVLCISGGEGYGKSYLFATVIKDLQERYLKVTDVLSRTSIAYYFFEQDSLSRGAPDTETDSSSLVKALNVLAYQLASHDPVYRKDLISSTKSMEANQVPQIWDILFSKSYKTDSTFFLLLDGADQIGRENVKQFLDVLMQLQKLSDTWDKFRLRILLSARDGTVEQIKNHLKEGTPVINVASKNGDDIEMFINDRLDRMEILSSQSAQVAALKKEILDSLLKEAHGDFINIGLLLNEIGDKQRPGEIRDVLAKSGEKRSDTIARKIERLNETLGEDNISDLNELLVWVMNGLRSPMLQELEAVLFLKNGESSLRSLADEINDRYSALFHIKGEPDPKTKSMLSTATVTLVSDSIEEYFKAKAATEEASDTHEWNTTGDVTESEVKIVRRFLDLVCDAKLFKKFEFDAFFERKLTSKTSKVNVDPDTAHLKVLMTCLQSITLEATDESALLLNYATAFFADHLKMVDLSLIQPQSKAVVGSQLVKLFTDEKVIQRWCTGDNLSMRYDWLYEDNRADVVLKWLQDSAVTKKLSEDDKKWIKSLSSKSEPDADLLEHVAKFMARQWLQIGKWEIGDTFFWINAYISKIANRKDPNFKRETANSEERNVMTSKIRDAAEWARQQLGLESLGYEETRNLARTLRRFQKLDDAVETFKQACSLRSDDCLSQWGLALTYSMQKKYALALEVAQALKVSLESGEVTDDEPESLIYDINRGLAYWHQESGNYEKAWEIYDSVMKADPNDYGAVYDMIWLLHTNGQYTQLLEMMENLKTSKDEKTGLDRRTRVFHEFSGDDDYHEAMDAAASNANHFTTVRESYQAAVDAAEAKMQLAKDEMDREEEGNAKAVLALLMHFYAKFFYSNHTCEEEKDASISMWVRILHLEEGGSDRYLLRVKQKAVEHLSKVYFQEALLAGVGTEVAAKHIDDLEHLSVLKVDENLSSLAKERYMYPKQLLARYYALCGETDKAKNAIRACIKVNIDLLSDDDPSNDWRGYDGLAENFMFAGQDDNCLASWSLITPDSEEENADIANAADGPDLAEKITKELEGPLNYYCDGYCDTSWTYANDIYICRQCRDVAFDEECLKKLRAGELKRRVCDKNHEMLHVPKYDKNELEKIGKGNVKVGSKIMTVEDWIQSIKQDWGISTE